MAKWLAGMVWLSCCVHAMAQKSAVDSLYRVVQQHPGDSVSKARYNYALGYEAYTQSAYDSAIYYLQLCNQSAKRLKLDTLSIRALNLIGDAYSDKGDNPESLVSYQSALTLAEKGGMREMQARIIKNIGILYVSWQKLPEALKHYDSALRIGVEIQDALLVADCKNNMGVVFEISKDYPKAIRYYEEALIYYKKIDKKESIAMVLSNLAIAYKYSGDLNKSVAYNKQALELAGIMHDKWKQAATLNNIGSTYLKMQDVEKAYAYALESVTLSEAIGAKEIQGYALETLSEAAYAKGNYKEAAEVMRRMMQVKDSFFNLESTKQVAELQTKYETAKKEQLIQKQQFDLKSKNYAITAILSGFGFSVFLAYSFYRRKQLQQEKEAKERMLQQQEEATRAVLNAESSERRRIAAELHDGVGQVMSAARMNLEAMVKELEPLSAEKRIKMERIVNLVDEGCKEVRSVSHSMMPNALLKKGLAGAVQDFIQKIDQQVIKAHLHIEGLQERLSPDTESVLYRIIQECVTNVIKHSGATQLDIALMREGTQLDITIEDNGKGFDINAKERGIGLQNIKARVQYLKGTLDLESAPGRGTFIGIHIPVTNPL